MTVELVILGCVVSIIAPPAVAFFGGMRTRRDIPGQGMWYLAGYILLFAIGATYFIVLTMWLWPQTGYKGSLAPLMLALATLYFFGELWLGHWLFKVTGMVAPQPLSRHTYA